MTLQVLLDAANNETVAAAKAADVIPPLVALLVAGEGQPIGRACVVYFLRCLPGEISVHSNMSTELI